MILSTHYLQCYWLGSELGLSEATAGLLEKSLVRLDRLLAKDRKAGIAAGYDPSKLTDQFKAQKWLKQCLGRIPSWLKAVRFDADPEEYKLQPFPKNINIFPALVYLITREDGTNEYLEVFTGTDYVVFDQCVGIKCPADEIKIATNTLEQLATQFPRLESMLFEGTILQATGDAAEIRVFEESIQNVEHINAFTYPPFCDQSRSGKWFLKSRWTGRQTEHEGKLWHQAEEHHCDQAHVEIANIVRPFCCLLASDAKIRFEHRLLTSQYPQLSKRPKLDQHIKQEIRELLATCRSNFLKFRELSNEMFGDRCHWSKEVQGQLNNKLEYVRTYYERLLGMPEVSEATGPEASRTASPWWTGSFYLLTMVAVMVVVAVISQKVSAYVLVVVIIAALLSVTVIGAFQLRNDEKLNEANFLTLIKESFKQMPLLRGSKSQKDSAEEQGS